MKHKIIAGNWKMNMNMNTATSLAEEIVQSIPKDINTQVIMHPPYPFLHQLAEIVSSLPKVAVGAQNVYPEQKGAFTGEVSGQMLKSCGVEYVIIGHSERRAYFNEDNDFICRKAKYAIDMGITPIICIGESLEIREQGKHFAHVINEMNQTTNEFSVDDMKKLVIAYEPIWAIGTGKTATPEQAQEMHHKLRSVLEERFGDIAEMVPLLYGGSMKPANAEELLSCEDIDGGLIGGASLKSEDFTSLIEIAESL